MARGFEFVGQWRGIMQARWCVNSEFSKLEGSSAISHAILCMFVLKLTRKLLLGLPFSVDRKVVGQGARLCKQPYVYTPK